MVYLLKMVIFHGYVSHNQMVIFSVTFLVKAQIPGETGRQPARKRSCLGHWRLVWTPICARLLRIMRLVRILQFVNELRTMVRMKDGLPQDFNMRRYQVPQSHGTTPDRC